MDKTSFNVKFFDWDYLHLTAQTKETYFNHFCLKSEYLNMFLDQDSKNFDQELTKPGNLNMEQPKIEKEDCQKEPVIFKSKQCSDCGSTFSTQSNLRLHVDAVHEKKRPYLCSECGDSFSTQNNLKRHISTVHKGQTTFKILILASHSNQSANGS